MDETIIYTIPGCPYCKAAMDDMRQRDVAFREIDVAGDQAARQDMVNLSGESTVPVIVENDRVTVGFGGG